MDDLTDTSTWPDWDLITDYEHELPFQTPGMKLELKSFDIRENSKGDKAPLQTGVKKSYSTEADEANESAMVVTKTYYSDKTLKQTELVIHSPHIIEAVKQVIKKYPGVNIGDKKITMLGRPACLFHYRKELVDYGRQLQDKTAAEHVAFALNYMSKALADDIVHYKNCTAKRDQPPGLDFDRLWMEYKPGDLIFVKRPRETWIGRLMSMTKHGIFSPWWSLKLERIITMIGEFYYAYETSVISSYDGFKYFKDLNTIPLRFHPDRQSIEQKMIERGKAFHALKGVHHRFYNGIVQWASDRKTEDDYDDDAHFENFQVS